MAELNQTLPLLPLTSGVVLPGMVFTMALETDEARAAADAGGAGRWPSSCSSPTSTAATRRSGWWPRSWKPVSCPAGPGPWWCAASSGSRSAPPFPAPGPALWVQVEPVTEGPDTPEATELAREYRAVLENILLTRGARRMAERLREVTEPSQMADLSGYSPGPDPGPEGRGPRDRRRRGAPAPGHRLGPGDPRRPDAARADQDQRRGGHGEDPARVPPAPPARGHPQGAQRARRHRRRGHCRRLPARRSRDATFPRPCARRSLREIDKLERTSEQNPEHGWIRTWLDTVLELPWGVVSPRTTSTSPTAAADPRRGPRRA